MPAAAPAAAVDVDDDCSWIGDLLDGSNTRAEAAQEPVPLEQMVESPPLTRSAADLESYCEQHMGIRASELKPNAMLKMLDLALLFTSLQSYGAIRFHAALPGGTNSIFGFESFHVDDMDAFIAAILSMINNDLKGCWHGDFVLRPHYHFHYHYHFNCNCCGSFC